MHTFHILQFQKKLRVFEFKWQELLMLASTASSLKCLWCFLSCGEIIYEVVLVPLNVDSLKQQKMRMNKSFPKKNFLGSIWDIFGSKKFDQNFLTFRMFLNLLTNYAFLY